MKAGAKTPAFLFYFTKLFTKHFQFVSQKLKFEVQNQTFIYFFVQILKFFVNLYY